MYYINVNKVCQVSFYKNRSGVSNSKMKCSPMNFATFPWGKPSPPSHLYIFLVEIYLFALHKKLPPSEWKAVENLLFFVLVSVELLELEKMFISCLGSFFALLEENFCSFGELTHKSCVTGLILDECLVVCVGFF